jgi:PAS domain S-box-containing protein
MLNEATSRENELFRMAVDLAPAGMLAVDERGIILLANREIVRLFGYAKEELIGAPVEMLISERFRDRHPGHRASYFAEATTRPMGSGRDLYGRHKDGTEVPVEIGLNPVRTGEQTVVLASVVDISARRRAEARFQAAVESSPSGMLMADSRGSILLVNREVERLFGYERAELIGQSVEMLVPARFRGAHPGQRATFFREPSTRPMGVGRDLYGLRKDGTEVPIEIGLNPIRTEEGTTVLCSVVDITTRRRTEEQARQSQKMEAIGTLAGGIAHDFNNLLLSIIGHAELIQAASSVHPEQRRDLDQILQAAERGRQLVQRILTFSRQREVARVPIQLEQTVREVLQLLRASLPTTVEIREHLSPATPRVLSDETQLHQVLMNLVTNAAHAMSSGGVLEVSSGPVQVTEEMASHFSARLEPGLYARLRVRDTGEGMSEDVLARVFEPFFTTKDAGRGSGLGLTVVHGIVQGHGGALNIESCAGEGTCVDVFLPADPSSTAALGEEDELSVPQRHILLVDDEPAIASMVGRQLNMLGYRVTAHTSSTDALETFLAQPDAFDALVTDNTMPKLTGLALAQRLLAVRRDLPVLLVSGLAAVTSWDELHAMGIRKVLPKPHTMDQLGAALAEMLPEEGRPSVGG